MRKSTLAPSVTGEYESLVTPRDRSWRISNNGKMKSPGFLSNLMKNKFSTRSLTMRKNSDNMWHRSAIPLWRLRMKPRLNDFTYGKSKEPKSFLRTKQISSDRSSISGHQLRQTPPPFLKPRNPQESLDLRNSRS